MRYLYFIIFFIIGSTFVCAQQGGNSFDIKRILSSRQAIILNQAKQGLQTPSGVIIEYGDIDYYGTGIPQEEQEIGSSGWLDEQGEVVVVGINFNVIESMTEGYNEAMSMILQLILLHEYGHIEDRFQPDPSAPGYAYWHAFLERDDAAALCSVISGILGGGSGVANSAEIAKKLCLFYQMMARSYSKVKESYPTIPDWNPCNPCGIFGISTSIPV